MPIREINRHAQLNQEITLQEKYQVKEEIPVVKEKCRVRETQVDKERCRAKEEIQADKGEIRETEEVN